MFTLPSLPYPENALAPVISANTLSFHHGKHHKTYVDNLNNLVKGTDLEGATLESIVQSTAGKADKAGIFNNAAQVWNHTFYWSSMSPKGGGAPGGAVKVIKTGNADTPIARGGTPLLTIDVWEHAYYLDYQNKRVDHVNAVIDKLLNWNFANENLSKGR